MKKIRCDQVWKSKEIKEKGQYCVEIITYPGDTEPTVTIQGKCLSCGNDFLIQGHLYESGLFCDVKTCQKKYVVENGILFALEDEDVEKEKKEKE